MADQNHELFCASAAFIQWRKIVERLAITLRFLATGDSYTSLMYTFKISKQVISKIVLELCEAIIEVLQDIGK
ncbi:hypothetical protein NQ314_017589, partial [Rhamnusium bicolor]